MKTLPIVEIRKKKENIELIKTLFLNFRDIAYYRRTLKKKYINLVPSRANSLQIMSFIKSKFTTD
jgi:hypothetical protein